MELYIGVKQIIVLSSFWCQAITWTSADMLYIGPKGINTNLKWSSNQKGTIYSNLLDLKNVFFFFFFEDQNVLVKMK